MPIIRLSIKKFSLETTKLTQISLNSCVCASRKVFGHIYNKKKNLTTEFYSVHKNDLNPNRNYTTFESLYQRLGRIGIIENFSIFNQSYLLNFALKRPDAILAERDQAADSTHLFLNSKNGYEPQFANIVYFNRIYVENSGNEGMDLRINVFYDQLEFNSSHTEGQLVATLIYSFGPEKERKTYRLSNKDNYRQFVFYMRDLEFGYRRLFHHQPIYFIGLDENSQIEFSVFNFFQNSHELLHQVLFDPGELFDCFTKLTNERQLKGIYYDRDSELFFVFIKRFYLKIHKIDLIDREFVLENDWYAEKAHRLVHRPTIEGRFYEKIDSEFLGRKWVKAIGPNTALYSPDNRNFFKLAVRDKDELTISGSSGSGVRSCYHQTLLVDEEHVFCFRKREYFFLYSLGNESYSHYWNKHRYPIAELFEETACDWTKQRLLAIFHYKEDRFVMLTQSDLFVFEYKKFTLWAGVNEEENKIRYLHDLDDKQIKRKRNCLLLGCKGTGSSPSDGGLTTPEGEPDNDGNLTLTLVFLIILAILLSILVLSVFINHILTNSNLCPSYNKYYNQPKTKDARKGRGSKSNQKNRFKFTMKVKR